MKKRFVLSFDDFVNSPHYVDFQKEHNHIMSFQQFVNAQNAGATPQIIAMTYDISKGKSRDYRELKRFLTKLGFQKQDFAGRSLPMNTYILPVNSDILHGIMTSIVGYLNTVGKNFKVFGCYTNSFHINRRP